MQYIFYKYPIANLDCRTLPEVSFKLNFKILLQIIMLNNLKKKTLWESIVLCSKCISKR